VQSFVPSLVEKPWFSHVRVVLVRPRNPLNIGAAARAMSNFGIRTLRLVDPFEPSFLSARSAVGAAETLQNAEVFHSLAEAVSDCTLVAGTTAVGERDLTYPLHRLAEGAARLRNEAARAPVALLFGSEKTGLSNEEFSHCHCLIRIPTRSEHISMNLGQAVAVCMYELIRDDASPTVPGHVPAATVAQTESLTQVTMDALRNSGYIAKLGPLAAEEKVRRLVQRMTMSRRDAESWLGMMRKILWKTRHPGE
jgi:tRNA/rRNA methyltransferase